jgi:hypothetical protein
VGLANSEVIDKHSRRCFSMVKDWVEKKVGGTGCVPGSAQGSAGKGGVASGSTAHAGYSNEYRVLQGASPAKAFPG